MKKFILIAAVAAIFMVLVMPPPINAGASYTTTDAICNIKCEITWTNAQIDGTDIAITNRATPAAWVIVVKTIDAVKIIEATNVVVSNRIYAIYQDAEEQKGQISPVIKASNFADYVSFCEVEIDVEISAVSMSALVTPTTTQVQRYPLEFEFIMESMSI